MLLTYETHRVVGLRFYDFEAAYRDGWLPAVAKQGGARLLWFFNVAHGANISFNAVTVTALRDWEDWEQLARRVQDGDLQQWAHEVDRLRYGSTGKLLRPLDWSPLQQLDLATVPATPQQHSLQMYVEDTIHPDAGDVEAGIRAIHDALPEQDAAGGQPLTELSGAFRTTPGAGRRREVVLLQKLLDLDLLARYYETGEAPAGAPWSAAHKPPPFADTWETRILRAAEWSPLN